LENLTTLDKRDLHPTVPAFRVRRDGNRQKATIGARNGAGRTEAGAEKYECNIPQAIRMRADRWPLDVGDMGMRPEP